MRQTKAELLGRVNWLEDRLAILIASHADLMDFARRASREYPRPDLDWSARIEHSAREAISNPRTGTERE